MKIKGAGVSFRPLFAVIAAIGLVAESARRAGDRLLWPRFESMCATRPVLARGPAPAAGAGLVGGAVMWDRWRGREPMT
jgi:hypothetical protein